MPVLLLSAILSAESMDSFDIADKILLGTLATESVYDVMHTRYCLNHVAGCYEEDPILPMHPDVGQLYVPMFLAKGAIWTGAYFLPDPWRKILIGLALAGETLNLYYVIKYETGHMFWYQIQF